jgi:hypothetical protein
MGSRPSPEITCILCSKPVDLRTDLCADENGKAMHEDCYVTHVTSNRDDPKLSESQEGFQMSDSLPSQAFIEFVNSASTSLGYELLPCLRNRIEISRFHVFLRRADLGNPTPDLRQVPSHYTRRPTTSSIDNKMAR